MVNVKHLFVVCFLTLISICTINALDMPIAIDKDGEAIYDNTTNELSIEEVLIVRQSLKIIGVCICVLGILSMLYIVYLMKKKK